MEIEQLAVERPEALARVAVDPVQGVDAAKAREIAEAGKIPADVIDEVSRDPRGHVDRSSSRRRPPSSRSTRCAARPTAASSRSTAR